MHIQIQSTHRAHTVERVSNAYMMECVQADTLMGYDDGGMGDENILGYG